MRVVPEEHFLPVLLRSIEVEKVNRARHPLLTAAVASLSNENKFCIFAAHKNDQILAKTGKIRLKLMQMKSI